MKIKLLLIAAILFSSSAFAQEVGRVTYVDGRVDMLKAGAKEAVMIKADEPVSVGDFIRTKSDSKAEIVFNDESVVRVAQNSRLQVKDYQFSGDKRKTATILLERGKARTTIAKMPGGTPFIILTPNAQGTIKGSDIFSFYQAGNSGMLVSEGMLSVINIARPDEIVTVRPGEAVLIPFQESPKGPRAFLEMEKRMEEVETNIPPALSRRKSMAVIMGTMVKFSGEVKVISKGKSAAHPARPNERLEAGDRIQTGKNGVAEIVFDNGNAMYLKSNTDITITKLINDPETQEYENLFDAKVGKIKARIERLSGKSKFEVRTPTAVCGARGTIMYLGVSETGETESFFEGGTGFVTSLENNQTEFVGAGEKAGVSVDGEVSDSAPVSESEQMSFDEGFDPGTGTEGQGTGSVDGYLYGSGDNTDSEGGIGAEGEADQAEGAAMDATFTEGDPAVGEVFIDIPVTEAGTVEEPTSEDPVTPTPTHDVLVGNTYTSQVVTTDPVLIQNGSLYDYKLDVTPVSIWAETPASATITAGVVLDTADTYHIWTVDTGNFHSYNSSTGLYTTSDGGAYYGLAGGIQGNISGTNKIENMLIAFYIDPLGNAGTFTGYFSGTNQEFFTLTGTVDATIKLSAFDILPENLYYNINEDGRFSGIGYNDFGSSGSEYVKINLDDGKAMNIDTVMGRDWGIWGARIAGSYKGDLTPALASNIQVSGLTESDIPVTRTDGAWLGWFNIGEWNANKVGGDMNGIHLALQSKGVLQGGNLKGNLMGCYIEVPVGNEGDWQAVSCGEWSDLATPINTANMTTLNNGITTMNVNVPITVADSAIGMSGSGSFIAGGVITPASMNINFYSMNAAELSGIWAGLVSGSFSGPTGDSWTANLNGTMNNPPTVPARPISATLVGTQWSSDAWEASVTGTANVNGTDASFSGVASGTHSIGTSGTLSGAATGAWTTP